MADPDPSDDEDEDDATYYCDSDDVALYWNTGRTFSDSDPVTKPSKAQIIEIIAGVHNNLDIELTKAGFALPVVNTLALGWLKTTCAVGSAYFASQSITGTSTTDQSVQPNALKIEYDARIESIRIGTDPPRDSGDVAGPYPLGLADVEDVSGNDPKVSKIDPWVTRDMRF